MELVTATELLEVLDDKNTEVRTTEKMTKILFCGTIASHKFSPQAPTSLNGLSGLADSNGKKITVHSVFIIGRSPGGRRN